MENVAKNLNGMIAQMIANEQNCITKKNHGKKNVGIDFIYIFQKIITL